MWIRVKTTFLITTYQSYAQTQQGFLFACARSHSTARHASKQVIALFLPGKYPIPVVRHADDCLAPLLCLVVQSLSEFSRHGYHVGLSTKMCGNHQGSGNISEFPVMPRQLAILRTREFLLYNPTA